MISNVLVFHQITLIYSLFYKFICFREGFLILIGFTPLNKAGDVLTGICVKQSNVYNVVVIYFISRRISVKKEFENMDIFIQSATKDLELTAKISTYRAIILRLFDSILNMLF